MTVVSALIRHGVEEDATGGWGSSRESASLGSSGAVSAAIGGCSTASGDWPRASAEQSQAVMPQSNTESHADHEHDDHAGARTVQGRQIVR